MPLFGEGRRKKRDSDLVPNLPILDLLLTLATLALFIGDSWALFHEGQEVLLEFLSALAATVVAISACKACSLPLGRRLSTSASLAKARNLRKFSDQSWQLLIHVGMTWYEWHVLSQFGWQWWTDRASHWSMPWTVAETASPPVLRRLFIAQLGVWFVTAFSHKFVEAKHKDYFVMYGHHVATLGLVTLSYFNGWTPVGCVVLFIHDSSDIIADTLKMVNYAGLDSSSGLFLAEAFFVANLFSWGYTRLWVFPQLCIRSTFIDYPYVYTLAGRTCQLLLVVLVLMHTWWYYLFLRILYRLLAGQAGHEAGGKEYEGSSDSEVDESKPKTDSKAD
jgi:ceramide synthetase